MLLCMTWQELAACAGMDTNMFFSRDNGKGGSRKDRERIEKAREVCTGCPVQRECLEYAIELDCVGVWGGMDTVERKQYAITHDLI